MIGFGLIVYALFAIPCAYPGARSTAGMQPRSLPPTRQERLSRVTLCDGWALPR